VNHSEIQIIGAIYIGMNNLHLTIAQVDESGEIKILEELLQPTAIGTDAFSKGRIMVTTMQETVKTLKGFKQILKEYRVKTCAAISTSALREANNRDNILEHIRINTGIEVDVINSPQERYLMYKALRYQFPWLGLSKESSLVINISSGGVELSIYEQGSLKLMEYINIGALRLHEMLAGLQVKTMDYSRVMEEFVHSRLSSIAPLIKKANINYFVGLGSDINTAAGLIRKDKDFTIDYDDIENIYKKLKSTKNELLMETYNLSSKQLDTLLPTVIILYSFLNLTHSKRIYVPRIELSHGILYDLTDSLYELPRQDEYYSDIISSVWYIANKYGLEKPHSAWVSRIALSVFDQTARYHQLGARERQYLQMGAILHTIGNFVNYSEQNQLAYELVRRQNIMGLSDRELDLIANIVYYHGTEVPKLHHTHYQRLSHDDKIIVSKLTAILKLADCLDISRNNKIHEIHINPKENTLDFTVVIKEPGPLEEWAFAQKAEYFEEVFGIQPRLKYKDKGRKSK